ncbi:AMP-binding protein [Paraburkholderia sp. J12]|uniref:AMP-binding protein n=1 Tax=Paraburkholderia sp. J12 TaxID=2805432 RepID=UPI002ABE3E9A|nr:AMP-binding protein [Paraburkholderia sp. J12]
MSSEHTHFADLPFRDAGFREPSVIVERREPGVLLLRSGHTLTGRPACTVDWLAHWIEKRPHAPMLVERDGSGAWQTMTCMQVWEAVQSIATSLLWAGASRERPVAILSENSTEQALLTWGALYAGVPVAPISPNFALMGGDYGRLRNAVSLVKPYIVFVQDAERLFGALAALDVPPERTVAVRKARPGMVQFADWAKQTPDPDLAAKHAALTPDMPAKYMFTSGSTGIPKAVVITRGMMVAAQEMTAHVFEQPSQTQPAYLEWLPWHHVMGGNIVLSRVLRYGATLYIDEGRPLPGRFDATRANLLDVAPSSYFNVPAGLAMLIAELERDEAFARHFFSRLAYVYYGGAVLSRELYDRFQKIAVTITGARVILTSAFGATETAGPAVTQYWGVDDVGCIGLPLPGVELKLVEDKNTPGRYEMRIRGDNILREYLDAPEQTKQAFDEEGFYLLGDAVRFVDPERPAAGLRFAGRFAEDFKLANGTWVRTAALRARVLDACGPLLKEAVIAHDGENTIGAMAWLDLAGCRKFLGSSADVEMEALCRNATVLAELARRLEAVNAGQTGASMRVEQLGLLTDPPSMQAGEVTDKGNLNQRAVIERRARDVEQLFSSRDGLRVIPLGKVAQ